jgi:ADP-ribose pyrophosphatase YjhB (NUDIX family)
MMEKSTPLPRPVLAVSLAVFRDGLVLVATRTKPPFEGAFSLPGGHVEAGETLEAAALRELNEEVGVTARIVAFNQHVETIRYENANQLSRHFVIASFVGAWVSGDGRLSPEVGEIRWVAPHDLNGLRTTPGLPAIVADASRIFARECSDDCA